MTSRSFDDRLERIQWTPGAVPSQDVIDSVLGGQRGLAKARSVGATLLGAISGICIGFGVKGMTLVGSPWGPDTGLAGMIGGGLSLTALAVSMALAIYVALRSHRHPWLMQFASMNLLMIVVLLLS
ncbi:hypothetical protein [Phaeobacter sp. 11ANDIMAR09]|uniref:hypothetical protein n=1 Tax=Phaeobacter sp. 11ANDIMAR09 TaxID=1225647 RepID=UPI0006C8BE73|nr:hypothetical protein [Phaeobacter sp. 11ANDIMAR09]KPD12071.1 hypothetical protein AN476_12340 [Phaeobacter sp. 11ANDIMAR09]OIQ34175.1 MAG: hypothetical protein BM559_08250 [Roseobacter sp. MedPE-SWchi]